jgi:hypothetical protein
MLRFRVGSTAVVLSLLSSCGARDALDVDGSSDVTSVGAAGPGPSTSPSSPASSGTGAGGTGAGAPCTNFVVDGEPYTIPAGQNATEPEVGVMPDGRLFVAWLAQSGALVGDATIDLDVWPHPFESISELAAPASAFVAGQGALGPVAFFGDSLGGTGLLRELFTGSPPSPTFNSTGKPLFAVDVGSRTLYALDEGGLLNVGSHALPAFAASHGPSICLGSKTLASAALKGNNVVVAYADSLAPGQSCFAQVPQPGLNLVTMRYEATGSPDASFNLAQAAVLTQAEPLLHLELASTGFGAYAVFQTDGSTSEVMPPIQAYLLDQGGGLQPRGAGPITLTGSGVATNTVAAVAMEEDLVIAWVDAIDPSAPLILVRRVRADGSIVAETSIPTLAAFLSGKLRMVTSPDQRHLLLAWTADVNKSVGVAKVSCSP